MTLEEFLNSFSFDSPDWSNLPSNWPNPVLSGLTSQQIGKFHAIKALWEVNRPEKPEQRSRAWKDPEGYKFLVQWSNVVLLRYLVRKLTDTLPVLKFRGHYRNIEEDGKGAPLQSSINPLPSSNRPSEHRRKAQLDDAARSVVRNIEEGYKRPSTKEYLDFIGYSQGSLEEVKGDIVELAQDGFLKTREGSSLRDLGIDLGEFHNCLKETKGFYRNLKELKGTPIHSSKFLYRPLEEIYPPLARISGTDLTVEQFIELINKTDFLLRKLVASLERKQNQEGKFYLVEQARIRDALKQKWK